MRHIVDTIKCKDGIVAHIIPDEDAQDPSDGFLCKITYRKDSRYTLGTEKIDETRKEELEGEIAAGKVIALPVWAYVHSGVKIHASSGNPFRCPWDSGQSGVAYVPKADALREFGSEADKLAASLDPDGYALTQETLTKVFECIRCEVETFSQYLEGDVYGVVIEDKDGNELESVWGFFGLTYAREEAERMGKVEVAYQRKKKRKESKERRFWEARGVVTA